MFIAAHDKCRLGCHGQIHIMGIIWIPRVRIYLWHMVHRTSVLCDVLNEPFDAFGCNTQLRLDLGRQFPDFLEDVITDNESKTSFLRESKTRRGRSPWIDESLCEDVAIKNDFIRFAKCHDEWCARRSVRISCFTRSNSSPSSSSVMPLSRNR